MKKIFVFICLFMVFSQADGQDSRLPQILLKRPDGSKIHASEIYNNGMPFITSFWATWYKFCLNKFNTIAVFYSKWQAEDGVKIVALSADTEPEKGILKTSLKNAIGLMSSI